MGKRSTTEKENKLNETSGLNSIVNNEKLFCEDLKNEFSQGMVLSSTIGSRIEQESTIPY